MLLAAIFYLAFLRHRLRTPGFEIPVASHLWNFARIGMI
jgi:hypothetical protein